MTRLQTRGFSLLEVILAVALTAIIAVLVVSAMDFHLRQLTVRRTRIEEAQIARAVLRRIADGGENFCRVLPGCGCISQCTSIDLSKFEEICCQIAALQREIVNGAAFGAQLSLYRHPHSAAAGTSSD